MSCGVSASLSSYVLLFKGWKQLKPEINLRFVFFKSKTNSNYRQHVKAEQFVELSCTKNIKCIIKDFDAISF